MTCESIHPLLPDYLADALPPNARAEVAAHLHACAGCRARVDEFEKLDSLLQEMPREAVSPQLVGRIRGEVQRRSLRGRLGHALPLALVTFFSLALFLWLANDTWIALQDRVMWEFVNWLVSMPELTWRHPTEILAGLADFAPLGRIFFTLVSALITLRLGTFLISEFTTAAPQSSFTR